MSHYLEDAAILDRDRAASLAANDAAMSMVPRELRKFRVQIRSRGGDVREFTADAHSSCEAVAQHADKLSPGERMSVRAVGVA